MKHYYSPRKISSYRPNRIIDLTQELAPRINELNALFRGGQYQQVLDVYYELNSQYPGFETDLVKVAYAFVMLGKVSEAENYLEDLISVSSQRLIETRNSDILENAFRLLDLIHESAEAFHRCMESLQPLWKFSPDDHMLRLQHFLQLTETTLGIDADEAEYYAYMAVQQLSRSGAEHPLLGKMLRLIADKKNGLLTTRVALQVKRLDEDLQHSIREKWPALYHPITSFLVGPEEIFTLADHVEAIKTQLRYAGNQLMQSLYETLATEEYTFAIAVK